MKRQLPKVGGGDPGEIVCPFTVLIDSREQKPYTFQGLSSGVVGRSPRLIVPCDRRAMITGDYGLLDHPGIALERKSKADLWSSISQARTNFTDRFERMATLEFSAIIVESEWSELLTSPPEFSKYPAKSIARSVIAWKIRYPKTQWEFLPSRQHAEAWTFRLLERFWREKHR